MDHFGKLKRKLLLPLLALLLCAFANSAYAAGIIYVKTELLTNKNIKFFVANLPADPSIAGDDIKVVPDIVEVIGLNTRYTFNDPVGKALVRVEDGTSYGQAYVKDFTGPPSVPVDTVDSLTFYQKSAPPAPPIVAKHEGYDPNLRPLIKVNVSGYLHPNHELSSNNYRYEVFEANAAIGPWTSKGQMDSDSTEWRPDAVLFDPIKTTKYYKFEAKAHNWFGYSTDTQTSNVLTVSALEGGVLQLDPGTITLRNGINFISMPFNRKGAEIEWYAYNATLLLVPPYPSIKFKNGQNKIETPRDLIDCINKLSEMQPGGPSKVVSTFGRWVEDGQPGQTSDKGLLFKDKDPNVLVKGDWNNISIKELKAENGYQVYISGLTKDIVLQITNTPPGPGQ